jgi:hypothetical protein
MRRDAFIPGDAVTSARVVDEAVQPVDYEVVSDSVSMRRRESDSPDLVRPQRVNVWRIVRVLVVAAACAVAFAHKANPPSPLLSFTVNKTITR